jgi:ABC-type multidrug transport system fused ATPase/permease subunit
VLKDISFKMPKGGLIGIIGPSGGGKTTLADLILRLFEPTSGTIMLDGKNISDIKLSDWRTKIGYVSQDVFLQDNSIRNNIKFYDEAMSEENILEAVKMANLYDFIKTLPKGLDTQVGDRGLLLSGGQRQRIALARVLARRPEILVLDEATSSLDSASEKLIKEDIEKLKGNITIIVIAHRLSTVADTDKIIALKDGSIVEEGNPATLLENKSSYFYQMYNIAFKANA